MADDAEPKPPAPKDPELAPLAASFERGDFGALSAQLEALPEGSRKAPMARPFLAATTVDPVHVGVIAACVLALIAIALEYLG